MSSLHFQHLYTSSSSGKSGWTALKMVFSSWESSVISLLQVGHFMLRSFGLPFCRLHAPILLETAGNSVPRLRLLVFWQARHTVFCDTPKASDNLNTSAPKPNHGSLGRGSPSECVRPLSCSGLGKQAHRGSDIQNTSASLESLSRRNSDMIASTSETPRSRYECEMPRLPLACLRFSSTPSALSVLNEDLQYANHHRIKSADDNQTNGELYYGDDCVE